MLKTLLIAAVFVSGAVAVPSRLLKQHGGAVRGPHKPKFERIKSAKAVKSALSNGQDVEFRADPDAVMVGTFGDEGTQPEIQFPGQSKKKFADAAADTGAKHDTEQGVQALVMPSKYDEERFLFWQTSKVNNPMRTAAGQLLKMSAKSTGKPSKVAFVQAARGSEYTLDVLRLSEANLVGQPVAWSVQASKGTLSSVILTVTKDGVGVAAAPFANGVASFTPPAAGTYRVQVSAVLTRPDGKELDRTFEDEFFVSPASVQGVKSVSLTQALEDGEHLAVLVSIALDTTDAVGTRYAFSSDLYGAGGEVSYVGGLADLTQAKTLEFFVQAEHFDKAAASAPFVLRHARLTSPDGAFLFATDPLAATASFERVPAAGSGGRRLLNAGEETDAQREARLQGGRMRPRPKVLHTSSAGHKKLLIHGYCSGYPAWRHAMTRRGNLNKGSGEATGDFGTNALEYIDPGADLVFNNADDGMPVSRPHDDFAQRVLAWSDTVAESCTIAAHSQGGAVSLHLWRYYHSCLDHAPAGKRLIHSVGTPYGGTYLAGDLAALGSVFGAGCGSNPTLTYDGAAAWLAGIPTGPNDIYGTQAVWYETNSVKDWNWSVDACAVTDYLLADPDDGITEMVRGQLAGAHNLGHRTGYCHTRSMNNPSQTGNMEEAHGTYRYLGGPTTGYPGASYKTYSNYVEPPVSDRTCAFQTSSGDWEYASSSCALQLREDNLILLADIIKRNQEWATYM